MRKAVVFAVLTLLLVTGGISRVGAGARGAQFMATCSGAEEVPARDTEATCQAIFRLSEDQSTLSYKLIVDNIENVIASHIHVAVFGVNGPVVAFLAGPLNPGGGPVQGILAQGNITSASLVGPLAGMSLSVLIAAMRDGGTYVNVHTNDGIDPQNTGAGDFPGGETRGQIRPLRGPNGATPAEPTP
jgi:CHRD domain-containing protein